KAAYDYHAFGEQLTLVEPTDKVTENFTGKERDDEIELNYFGARYLDPMLGMWASVDPARQFSSQYLYAGNGMNPVVGVDGDGMYYEDEQGNRTMGKYVHNYNQGKVSTNNLLLMQAAINRFEQSPGAYEALMAMAKYSYLNDVETRFLYGANGPDMESFWYGNRNSVSSAFKIGFDYIHVHTFRSSGSIHDEGLSPPDYAVAMTGVAKEIFALELRTGNVFYFSPKFDEENQLKKYNGFTQYPIMYFPTWNAEWLMNQGDFSGEIKGNKPSLE
ncbi:MAG: hypothetical protein MJZ22_04790, partial [Candidatus Saccharibacteria bacterium]|nr:hypothetical protein [Candidatus Saccharibacteria bacterium]